MSSTSMKPTSIAPALTVTISSTTSISFNPANAQVAPGGVVSFASANSSAWEIELWNRENDDPHPLRLYVPPSGESAMIADPMSVPRDVKFNVMAFPGGNSGPVLTGGTYTIKIVGGAGGPK
jgi:plastocyanin